MESIDWNNIFTGMLGLFNLGTVIYIFYVTQRNSQRNRYYDLYPYYSEVIRLCRVYKQKPTKENYTNLNEYIKIYMPTPFIDAIRNKDVDVDHIYLLAKYEQSRLLLK